MNYAFTFTVFTPTYNRAHTLRRVYESLCAQTYRDFEWLVIDDGSTDGTDALVQGWQAEADFAIRYTWLEHGGKHTAYNFAISEARSLYFVELDSDDECTANGLEKLLEIWKSIPLHERLYYEGVTARCVDQHGQFIGEPYPYVPYDSNLLDLFYIAKIHGERWRCSRTDVLRKYPFPVLTRASSNISENIVWMRIARSYRTRYVNDALLTYHMESPDALSLVRPDMGDLRRIAPATLLRNQVILVEHIDYLKQFPEFFIREAVLYVRFSWYCKRSLAEQWRRLGSATARLLLLTTLIPGTLLYLRDQMRG